LLFLGAAQHVIGPVKRTGPNRRFAVTRTNCALVASLFLTGAVILTGQGASKNYKGIELSIGGVERASRVSLTDCPPGANTVSSTAKPGEEFAVVTLNAKVSPAYKPEPIRRPTLTDQAGKVYNTAVSFVDVGKTPEFSCAIPFRVPADAKLKSLQVDGVSLDIP
jgi:hypothetical protein